MSSLRVNLVVNYAGQAFVAVIGIVMLPVYIRYLGAEAYGLVGFYTVVQTWFLLLDLGLTPTLSRELARYRAGKTGGAETVAMIRAMEWLFLGFGCVSLVALACGASWISRHWLHPEQLSADEVGESLWLMGLMIAPRWLVGLYRGGLVGLEEMVPLNLAASAIAAIRSVGVCLVLVYWSRRPSAFFVYQAVVGLLEVALLRSLFYRWFRERSGRFWPEFASLRGHAKMAGSMAILGVIWIVMSQSDKLILSGILDLRAYGIFAVAVTMAGGITLFTVPMSQTLQPRFTYLAARNEDAQLVRLFRLSTQVACALFAAIAATMATFSWPLIEAWTGSAGTADEASRILSLYAVGNAVTTLTALAFMVQFAYGVLRWHLIGNFVFGLLWIPGAYLAARHAGGAGAGWVWVAGNLIFLLCWLPFVFSRLIPSLTWSWLVRDVGVVVLAEGLVVILLSRLDLRELPRAAILASLTGVGGLLGLIGLLAGDLTRPVILRWVRTIILRHPA